MLEEFGGDFIQWLRGFYYTATCGNMTAAMKEMHRNQSALTYQIKSLEKEFGVKLFTGTKNNRILTEEGKLLLNRTAQLFGFIKDLREQLAKMPSDVRGELRIGAMFSFYNHILPLLVQRFAASFPDVLFRLSSGLLEARLFEEIASSKVDMGILSSDRIPEEFMAIPLFQSELVLVTPAQLVVNQDRITLDFIKNLPLGAPMPKSSLWLNICRQCQQYGITLMPKHVIEHQDCLLQCVAAGMCCTILDRFVADDVPWLKFNIYSLKNIFRPRPYYLVMQKNSPYQYPQVKAFYTFILQQFEVEVPENS